MKYLFSFQFLAALFLILWGVSLFIEAIFKIHIPLGRIFFGILLVLFGISIIFFGNPFFAFNKGAFNQTIVLPKDGNEMEVTFATTTIDFSKLTDEEKGRLRKINVGFSNLEIILDDNEYNIDIESGFSSIEAPDNSFTFGKSSYKSRSTREDKAIYRFKISAGFSRVAIRD